MLFIAGNDADAKRETTDILEQFGWPRERVVDLGDLTGARAMEHYLMLWFRLMQTVGHSTFNISLQVGTPPA